MQKWITWMPIETGVARFCGVWGDPMQKPTSPPVGFLPSAFVNVVLFSSDPLSCCGRLLRSSDRDVEKRSLSLSNTILSVCLSEQGRKNA